MLTAHLPFMCSFRYCQKLPCDKYTVLAPGFSISKRKREGGASFPDDDDSDDEDEDCDPKHEYHCELTLPMNCPVKTPVKVGQANKEQSAP